ncbi:MDR family NADP-dependent oxidoreductase [Actinomycetospora termitidis]|uniref:NADP-dependent oxidoreductase n=1 Tax=Actinomycetospora termitidis TaxID=3053470 RepID=A0ABT7MDQ9_9PSEU|nr:NADP-dependent oxidoreductase [Actinomycetospora sp. Odt1-22]MDL5158793.1 NADP-dependent oxidoreductase [Actinomycetospora sp. Odt1-22]
MNPTPPHSTRQVLLAARPEGALTLDAFRTVEVDLPAPGPGQVVVRNSHLSLGAVMREQMEADANLPDALPIFRVGEPLEAFAVGTVVAGAADDLPVGTTVVYGSPWAEYAVTSAAVPLPADSLPEPQYAFATGNVATALLGVRDGARVGDGDVVLVTGAAGGVGSMAGQIARKLGAARVVGTAGSAAKCSWLVDELGFDAAVGHRSDSFLDELRAAAPEGFSVVVDLVGGAQFETAVELAAPHARIAVLGALAAQSGGGWPRFDTQTAIMKGLHVSGFALAHAPHLMAEAPALFGRWLGEGMVYPNTVVDGGLDAAPQALIDLLAGAYTGSVSVRL